MTGRGVPDDDMPDSILPPWGSPPFDERDLEALLAGIAMDGNSLSGHASGVPAALRQVADTLAAFRDVPSPAELRGEAAIRAEFRALARFRAPVLPPAAGHDHRRHDHRRHGQRKHGRRGQAVARARWGKLAAAAAVAAAVVAAAYSSDLPGRMERIALSASHSGTPKPASHGIDARSSRSARSPGHPPVVNSPLSVPTAPPSARRAPAVSKAELCHAFMTSLEHPSPFQPWWQAPAYKNLSAAAGGQERVPGYCAAEWAKDRPRDYRQAPVFPVIGKGTSWNQQNGAGSPGGAWHAQTQSRGGGQSQGPALNQSPTPGAPGGPMSVGF